MQRLAPGDPTGLFLKRGSRHVCLPARLSEDVRPKHLRKYYRKGLLDPVRKGPAALRRAEQDLGSYAFQGQYMQRPGPKGGAMFKTDRFILIDSLSEIGEDVVMWSRGWDKAGTQDGGSFTVGAKLGKTAGGRFVVADVKRDQIDSGRREIWIRRTAEQDGYGVKVGVEQEGASGGKESAENTVRNLAGFSVEVVKVGKSLGDLVHRADPFSTQVNNGNVFVLRRDWTEEFVEEFKHFPNGKYNDQVAACACVAFPMLYRRRRRKGGFQELLYSNLEKEMQRR
jgi:predicted phage terminase large subunit-like protein